MHCNHHHHRQLSVQIPKFLKAHTRACGNEQIVPRVTAVRVAARRQMEMMAVIAYEQMEDVLDGRGLSGLSRYELKLASWYHPHILA